jgi:hypothetical protein
VIPRIFTRTTALVRDVRETTHRQLPGGESLRPGDDVDVRVAISDDLEVVAL